MRNAYGHACERAFAKVERDKKKIIISIILASKLYCRLKKYIYIRDIVCNNEYLFYFFFIEFSMHNYNKTKYLHNYKYMLTIDE